MKVVKLEQPVRGLVSRQRYFEFLAMTKELGRPPIKKDIVRLAHDNPVKYESWAELFAKYNHESAKLLWESMKCGAALHGIKIKKIGTVNTYPAISAQLREDGLYEYVTTDSIICDVAKKKTARR